MQDSIAQVLDSIQYKITLNNRLNDYLLEVGEMRFADLETRGTLSKTVHIADLPHILETGKRPKGGAASCGIPSVGAENVKKLGEFNYSSNKYIPRTFADNLKKGRVNGYELMIYKDGGRPGQFIPHFSMFGEGYPYKEFYINEHVFKLDFGDRGLNEFAYYYFHTPYVMKWLETNGTKAAIPGINRQNIEELEFPDPEQESVQDFCKRIQPYFTAIFRNCLENKQLQSLRDTLLPRLMSGEIDVSKVDLTQLTNNHLSGCGSFCSVCCPFGLASEFHEWFREHFFFGYGHLCKADLG
ncbi:restriction endonuclease subunit S, partial [Algiphilus sp. NNCM1]|nr:restriction endonuclease subunit S [Algiphilus acroporae]